MLKKIGKIIIDIILFPFRLIKKLIDKIKKNNADRREFLLNKKIIIAKKYIDLANEQKIFYNITSNYDNELIIHLTNDPKFKVAKPIKTKEKEEI